MKICKLCQIEKPDDSFNKEPRVTDGLTAICKDCNRERGTKWRTDNREHYNAIQAKWRTAHPDTALEKGRRWRENNRARSNAFSRKWARANREKVKARRERWVSENRARVTLYAEERRARDAGASGTTTPEQLQARIDYYGGLCWVCRNPFEAIDHFISLKMGGTNWPANLRPICKSCNSSKGASHPHVFLARRSL